jgi:hypothetical protein
VSQLAVRAEGFQGLRAADAHARRRSAAVIASPRPSRDCRCPGCAFPRFRAPCDPTLREQAPSGSDWLHEIKIDGYRAQLHICDGQIRVYSRSGYDWTEQFHQIAQAAQALTSHDLIIDGEATVLGNTGLPDFQQLRRELAKQHSDRLIYHAFGVRRAQPTAISRSSPSLACEVADIGLQRSPRARVPSSIAARTPEERSRRPRERRVRRTRKRALRWRAARTAALAGERLAPVGILKDHAPTGRLCS